LTLGLNPCRERFAHRQASVRNLQDLPVAAGSLALSLAISNRAAAASNGLEPPMASAVPYVEHHITHGGHMIYAREYPGQDPAYVMMHGFPDNLHIYDYVVPYLTQAGRRVVVFDFLGFGQSEKVTQKNYPYTFEQQVGDFEAGHWLMIDKPEEVARLLLAEG
jgi:alpha/beta hydrolase fold